MEKFCFVSDQIVILHGSLRLSKTVNKTFYITLSISSEVAAFGVEKEEVPGVCTSPGCATTTCWWQEVLSQPL